MLASRLLLPAPDKADHISQTNGERLAVLAGLVRQTSAGVYTLLPIGRRVVAAIDRIIRSHMTDVGAIEVTLPSLQLMDLWTSEAGSGRWSAFGDGIFVVGDRARRLCLAPSNEEQVTRLLAASGSFSYKDLPFTVCTLGRLFRRGLEAHGLHRAIEFPVHETYVFATGDQVVAIQERLQHTYLAILHDCGVTTARESGSSPEEQLTTVNLYALTRATALDHIAWCETCDVAGRLPGTGEILACPRCGRQRDRRGGLRVAQVRRHGDHYCRTFGLGVEDGNHRRVIPHMVAAGLSIYYLFIACLEQHQSAAGIAWPNSIAPFRIVVMSVEERGSRSFSVAERLYEGLKGRGCPVLLDDRRLPLTRKELLADLLGTRVRVVVGPRSIAHDQVEVTAPGERAAVSIAEAEVFAHNLCQEPGDRTDLMQ